MDENGTENGNSSSEGMKFRTSEHLPYVIVCVLIVLLNTLVILLFAFNRNLQKACNFLLVSLSVSDLLTGLVGLPLILVCSTMPFCLPCVFSFSFVIFTSVSTVLHIVVISYERYIQIVFPFKTLPIGRKGFELKLMASIWFVSFVIPCIQYIWLPPTKSSCTEPMGDDVLLKEKIYFGFIMSVFFALPIVLLIYADVSVFFVVRRQLQGIDKTTLDVQDTQQRLKKERRVLLLFAVMMVYFVISWSVYYAAMLYHSVIGGEDKFIPDEFHMTVNILRVSTPLVNPILYILLKHDFRRVVCTGGRHLANRYRAGIRKGSAQYTAPTTCPSSESRNAANERTVFLS